MIRTYSARLFIGTPQVSQSVTPAKRNAPRKNPTAIEAIRGHARGGAEERSSIGDASRGKSTTPSLQRTAKAAPARSPAPIGGPRLPLRDVASRKAARSIAVEIGRGKGLAP